MKRNLILFFAALFLPLAVHAQTWMDAGPFPPDSSMKLTLHGVAVDAEDKVWVVPWGTVEVPDPTQGGTVSTRVLYVYNADGTEVDFSPVSHAEVNGDTLSLSEIFSNPRGLAADMDGNILLATGSSILLRFDHRTGAIMAISEDLGLGSLTSPGVDANGNIYVGSVLPGRPILQLTHDFTVSGIVTDSSSNFSRQAAVTADGNTVYRCSIDENGGILTHSRGSEFEPYGPVDTTMAGAICEAADRHPVTNNMWFSNNPDSDHWPGEPFADVSQQLTWYEWDPVNMMILDSLDFHSDVSMNPMPPPNNMDLARGFHFNSDGTVAYAALWQASEGRVSLKKFVQVVNDRIEIHEPEIPATFVLEQNYPNPFNPETRIEFALTEAGDTQLTVYNVLGQEVSTLVDEYLSAGTYTATFYAGQDLSSGTYFYRLTSGDQSQIGKMLLIK